MNSTLLKKASLDTIYFWGLLAFGIVIVWFAPYLIGSDGMTHSYMGLLIKQLWQNDPYITQYYRFTDAIIPNTTAQLILAGLQFFTSAIIAEKTTFTLIAIVYMLAIRRFLGLFLQNHTLSYYLPFLFFIQANLQAVASIIFCQLRLLYC